MATQLDVLVRNAGLDAYETAIGPAPTLKLWTGVLPANTAAADSGTAVLSLTLPSDWMAAASGGTKAKSGTWSGLGAAAGVAVHYRIYDSGGTCRLQGTVTLTGAGGDMTADNTNIAVGQAVTVTTYTWTAANS